MNKANRMGICLTRLPTIIGFMGLFNSPKIIKPIKTLPTPNPIRGTKIKKELL
jgi:hypothetical protein